MIEAAQDDEALAMTLAMLVPGAVEGVISDVTIIDRGMNEASRTVADAAGCRIMPSSDMHAALIGARSDWLMMIEPGARLLPGWIERLSSHLGYDGRPARFKRAHQARASVLERFRQQRSTLALGLVVKKSAIATRLEGAVGLRDVAKLVKPMTLDCAIVPAGRAPRRA
ncbi:glycosyl transferase family 2 [Rhizobium sp. EC-SD404]|uniref:glycosyl transferase family 2 n=1 Tax=Rhizobium sp. EC-SD404 TaxID=2038389 RepID=UPI00125FEF3F|nr:glycosyl transferase family 2 [Rhizobium sp. EC-SD404]